MYFKTITLICQKGLRDRPELPKASGLRSIHPYQGINLFIIPLWYITVYQLLMNHFYHEILNIINSIPLQHRSCYKMIVLTFDAVLNGKSTSHQRHVCGLFICVSVTWHHSSWCSSTNNYPGWQSSIIALILMPFNNDKYCCTSRIVSILYHLHYNNNHKIKSSMKYYLQNNISNPPKNIYNNWLSSCWDNCI